MKKEELITKVAQNCGVAKYEVQAVVAALEDEVLNVIANEDSVRLGFGTIGGKTSAPRIARNPKTGERVDVPAKHGRPYMKFSKAAKQ